MSACDECLRRTWLIARLAGWVELARHQGKRLPEVLALSDDDLLRAVAPSEHARSLRELAALDLGVFRGAYARAGLEADCRHARGYPAALRDDRSAPAVVSRTGPLPGGPAVAVVGTRRASPDGLEIARGLGRGLAAAGVTVVSGMALGIDSAAHEGALQAGGPTVAVLAGGADVAYPRSKRGLHVRIGECGAVVSEMPPGFVPRRWCFPARNRIIAGLASVTIVVQAALRSGSLITAELATDLGRDIGAVPGSPLDWHSAGANALLRDGATVVRDAVDALDLALGVGHGLGTDADAREAGLDPALRT
ncbi:MAG: processing protein, partial [Solirubrobacteraceae bacterium]|nr:processing protein [Solirubrobacteraceae bacterium]